MSEIGLTIGGDPSGALAAIGAVKAALAGLQGKTITVDVKTSMDKALGDLGSVAKASNSAADAARDHGRAADDAARSVRDHASASDRAAASARDHAAATDRAGSSARGAAAWFQDVAKWTDQAGQSAVRSSSAMGELGGSTSGAGGAMRELGGSAQRADRFMVSAGGSASRVGSSLARMGDGASGSGRELERMGSSGGRAMLELTRGSDGVYKAITAVGRVADSVGGGGSSTGGLLGGAAAAAGGLSEALGGMGKVAGSAAGSLKLVGMAGLVGAAGGGIAAAIAAGTGLAGAIGVISQSSAAMGQVRKTVAGVKDEFNDAAAGIGSFIPQMGMVRSAVTSAAGALAEVGVKNMGASLTAAASVATTMQNTIAGIEPAIEPSLRGAATLVNSVGTGFAAATPAIAQFANTVDASGPGLAKFVEGTTRSLAVAGGITTEALAAVGPMITPETVLGGLGAFSGAGIGGTIGAILGSIVPGVGTALGGLAGAGLGGLIGGGVGVASALSYENSNPQSSEVVTQTGGRLPKAAMAAPNQPVTSFDQMNATADRNAVMSAGREGQNAGMAPPGPRSVSPPGVYTGRPASDFPGTQMAPQPGSPAALGTGTSTTAPPPTAAGAGAPPPPPKPVSTPGGGISGGGSSGPSIANVSTVQALNQALAQTPTAMNAAGAAGAQMGSQMAAGMQQAGGSAQPAAQQVSQGAAQMAQAAPQATAAAAAPPPPPPPAAAPKPPPPPAAPAAAAVAKTTAAVASSAAPAAAAGGESIGASIGGGMGKGVTKEITNTLTIVKKWIVKVIETAAGALDAHSPSRVFAALGSSIPQGLVVGMQAQAPAALSATQAMIKQVTAGAQSQLSSAQPALNKAYMAALAPPQGQSPQQQTPAVPLTTAAQRRPDALYGEEKRRAAQQEAQRKQDPNQMTAAERAKYDQDKSFEANKKGLEERGLTPESADAKAKLIAKHNERKKQIDARRRAAADAAVLRSRGETVADTGDPIKDAEANKTAAAGLTNKKKKHDDNKLTAQDRLKHFAEVRAGTYSPDPALGVPTAGQPAPPPPLSSKAMDLAAKKKTHDDAQTVAKNTLKNFPGVAGGVKQSSNEVGKAIPGGMAGGINANAGGPADAADKMAGKAIDAAKKKTKTKSPSQEFHDIGKSTAEGMANGMNAGAGLASGIGAGISEASNAIQGIADDRGLQIGYRYAQSMVSGINSVLKSDDFKAAAIPQIDSPQAKAALGDMGLLGPAGSGAQVWKSVMVSMGAGTPAAPPAINLTLTLDGDPFRQLVLNQQDNLVSALLNQLKLQKN